MSPWNDPIHPPSEDLFAYRDGELGPEKRALIEAHVQGCSICRSFVDQVSSIEAELRQSPDRAPSEYLERLHESVRARIAAGGPEEIGAAGAAGEARRAEDTPPARDAHGRAGAWRERERRRIAAKEARDDGRIKEVPRLPWAAVLSTVSAAAAVLVVVGILIKQGLYQQPVAPKAPTVASRGPEEAMPGDSEAPSDGRKSDVGVGEREAALGNLARGKSSDQDMQGRRDAKLEGKDTPAARENLGLAKTADGSARAPSADGIAPESQTGQFREEPPAASKRVAESQKPGANMTQRSQAEDLNAGAGRPDAAAGAYEVLIARFGLPPVWDGATVSPETLERAEPELLDLYLSGEAGADSARVRLYLAEAARLRYAPGDATLHQEIERHYRRAIELAGPDAETARVAEERLRTLER